MSSTIFQNEKTPFQAIKTRSSKSRKIDIFPKVLTHGLGPRMASFLTFSFREYRPGKCLLRYCTTQKLFSRLQKQEVQKNIDIFVKGLTHGFGLKMAIFPTFLFLAIYARKTCFTIFQNEKTTFQAVKTRSSKSRKIDIFPKGFGFKNGHFPNFFFLRQYRPGKVLLRYSRLKKRLSIL